MNNQIELFQAEKLPVFQNKVYSSSVEAENCPVGDIVLVQDRTTGLIYNKAFQPELMVYDGKYQNEQACSGAFQDHLQNVSKIIGNHMPEKKLVEIGCGKGYFLEYLQGKGFDIQGYDPTYEGTNPVISKKYFTPDIGFHADGLILRHVLEHVQNPFSFLETICSANGGNGLIYIEVPCLEWIRHNRAWFDIYYEHVNYFRISDIQKMFGAIHEAGHTFGGQYLYVIADLASLRKPVYGASDTFSFPEQFKEPLFDAIALIKKNENRQVAIWGGSSKGVIFGLNLLRMGVTVTCVVDINPAKQGKFLPVTGLPVLSPDEAMQLLSPDAELFVMNSNYLKEIVTLTKNKYHYVEVIHNVSV